MAQMKKNKKKIIGFSTLGVVGTAAAAMTITACSPSSSTGIPTESWIGSHNDLNQTINSQNQYNVKWFSTVAAKANMTSASFSGIMDANGKLFTYAYTDKVHVNAADINPATGELNAPLVKPTKYIKMELAKAVILVVPGQNGQDQEITFDDDDPSNMDDDNNINSDNFKTQLKAAKSIKIKLRDAKWIDSSGNETKYKITSKDFVTGSQFEQINLMHSIRVGMTKKANREKVDSIEAAMNTDHKAAFNTFDIDNTYLYDIGNVDVKNVNGINSDDLDNVFIDQNIVNSIAPDDETLNYKFNTLGSGEIENHNFFFQNQFLNGSYLRSPVPTQWIKDNMSSVVPLDSYTLSQDELLTQLGFYRYGRDYSNRLYSGSYYISKVSKTKNKVIKNMHYARKDFVNDPKTVNSFTTNFVISSPDIWPRILWEKYKQGTEFELPSKLLNKLPSTDVEDLYAKYNENGKFDAFQFDVSYPNSNGPQILWQHSLVQPAIKNILEGKSTIYDMNSDLSKILFGLSFDEIKAQKDTASPLDSLFGSGLVFRNLLQASINWYTVIQKVYPGYAEWFLNVPPGAGTGSQTNNQILVNLGEVLHDVKVYDYDPNTKLATLPSQPLVSTIKENKQAYLDNVGNQEKQLESSIFDEVKKKMATFLDQMFPDGKQHTLNLMLPLRSGFNGDKNLFSTYHEVEKIIESLSTDRIKLTVSNDWFGDNINVPFNGGISWVASEQHKVSQFSYFGWSSDTDNYPTYLYGLLVQSYSGSNASPLMTAFSALADPDAKFNTLRTMLPESTKIAENLKTNINSWIQALSSQVTANPSDFVQAHDNVSADQAKTNLLNKLNALTFEGLHNIVFDKAGYGWSQIGDLAKKLDIDIDSLTIKGKKELVGIFSTKIESLLMLSSQSVFNNDNDQIKNFIKEYNDILGRPMTIDSPAEVTVPRPNLPNANLIKNWLIIPPEVSGSVYLEQWKVE
ncbi:MAG: hypothetical protein NC236_01195 [Mycoplasma sp.]|nr:hypothetical protein [Mycoplasma sp.]